MGVFPESIPIAADTLTEAWIRSGLSGIPRPSIVGRARAPVGVSIFSSYANGIGAVASLQEMIAVDIAARTGHRAELNSGADRYVQHLLDAASRSANSDWPSNIRVSISSRVPAGRGLKTSSALGVAATAASFQALGFHAQIHQIAETASRAATHAQVTQAGSVDDVFASIHGGVVIADCQRGRLLASSSAPCGYEVLLHVSDEILPVAHRLNRPSVLRPYAASFDGFLQRLVHTSDRESALFGVMTDAALITARALSYPAAPLQAPLSSGAVAVTLSGKGPAIGAVVTPRYVDAVIDSWAAYPGTIIRTRFSNAGLTMGDNKSCRDVPSRRPLFRWEAYR